MGFTGRRSFSRFGEIWCRLTKNKAAMAGLFIVIAVILIAIFSNVLVDYDTQVVKTNIKDRLTLPCKEYLLGTDELGRDILSRIIYGSRMSLMIGALGVIFSLTVGIVFGSLAAFYGGTLETVIMRICDVFEGLPSFLLAIVITSAFGTSIFTLMLAITFGSFSSCIRIMRGAVLTVKDQEFIEAAYAMGANNWQIITYHIMPNCVATIIVQATLRIGTGITTASALSFLGLGVQPPDPEWGAMLSSGRQFLLEAPYLTMFPGLALMITILAFNMLGDGLRDALDPRLKQ
ncbi:MAG TPA: ABC transporter permease [Negativicutes bacterium]|nr:ABC transporter permease [Negativicutes bacterium]